MDLLGIQQKNCYLELIDLQFKTDPYDIKNSIALYLVENIKVRCIKHVTTRLFLIVLSVKIEISTFYMCLEVSLSMCI